MLGAVAVRHRDARAAETDRLFLSGESYAGHYVPHIATYILEHGAEPLYAPLRRQLVGVGLGDVCPGEEHTLSLPDLMHGLGYLSPAQLVQAHATASRCQADLYGGDFAAAFKSCEALEVYLRFCADVKQWQRAEALLGGCGIESRKDTPSRVGCMEWSAAEREDKST